MAQRWYQKASVQTALVSGVFTVIAAIIVGFFGLYQGWFTSESSISEASKESQSIRSEAPTKVTDAKEKTKKKLCRGK